MVGIGSGFSVGFVGREAQLAVVASAAQAAAAGRPGAIWVEGVAGSGKTTFIRHALTSLPTDLVTLRVQCDEVGKDEDYELAGQLGVTGAGSPFAAAQQLLDKWSHLQELGPVVVAVEDVHWADAPSALALISAIRRLDQDRILFLFTSRPEAGPEWERLRGDEERCSRVTVGSFDADEVARLAALDDVELSPREAIRLWSHTGGHPIWVKTLLAELTPAELKVPEGDLPAPRSLASAVTARLGGLPGDARDLVSALAVLSQRSPLPVAARVAGIAAPLEALESLLATGFVRWEPNQPGPPVEFTHRLYRQAVYEDLAPTRRRDLHRAAARVLTPGSVLAHRVAAAEGTDDGLADELEAVAESSLAVGAIGEAARTLLWASSLTESSEHAERRLLEATLAYLDSGDSAQAARLRSQVQACQSSLLRNLVLGLIDWELGDAAAAERWLRRAVEHPLAEQDRPMLARAWAQVAEVNTLAGRAEQAVDAAEQALALAVRDTAAERIAWLHLATGEGMLRGGPSGLRRLAERLPERPEEIDTTELDLLVTRGNIAYYSGRIPQARADLEVVLGLARRGHVPVQLARCHYLMASILTSTGEWDDAELHARTALSVATDDRLVWMQSQCHAALSILNGYRGEWDAAEFHRERGRGLAHGADNLEAAALVRIADAALGRARAQPASIIDALGALGDVTPMLAGLYFWLPLMSALIDSGDLAAAATQIDAFSAAAAARGIDVGSSVIGMQARLAAAANESDRAAELFEQALADPGEYVPYLDQALWHHEYAKMLLAKGNRALATRHFRSARDMLAGAKAEPFVARIDADLGDARLLPRQRSASQPAFELTDRERDVALLVARGLSNPEVAARLYVSRKAVEYHLSNIYAKVGISSRRELREAQLAL
ncbi:MAG TPA: AAA family ATPase [Frankiaceae bacterium]|jgi:DNA-binding CsgD family transcriptional regulator|nr:AAA family ATPase [Frankiaceae bacterium]